MKTKGFIGLGVMGFPMAGHISKAYPTQVYNRSLSKAKDWVDLYSGISTQGRIPVQSFVTIGKCH